DGGRGVEDSAPATQPACRPRAPAAHPAASKELLKPGEDVAHVRGVRDVAAETTAELAERGARLLERLHRRVRQLAGAHDVAGRGGPRRRRPADGPGRAEHEIVRA